MELADASGTTGHDMTRARFRTLRVFVPSAGTLGNVAHLLNGLVDVPMMYLFTDTSGGPATTTGFQGGMAVGFMLRGLSGWNGRFRVQALRVIRFGWCC